MSPERGLLTVGNKTYNFNVSHKRKPEHAIKLNVIQPKSVLNRSGMGGFTLNPYVGCPVGCSYCYVPHMAHNRAEQRKWGTYVDVKVGAVELLEQKLARMRKPTTVFMSSATDPYQPVEERYRITRAMLEVFERHPRHGLFVLTKQPLVERDADILARLPRVAVGFSVSVMKDELAAVIEPWAPVTSERLAVLGRLSARGIATYVLWAPAIVPIEFTAEFVTASVEKIAASNARSLSLDSMNYRSEQPPGLMSRLAREGHTLATPAQLALIRKEADRRGLGERLELMEAEPVEEISPLLPF